MKPQHLLFSLFFIITSYALCQEKEITLEEIWNGTFRQDRLESLNSLNNGKEYIVLNQDRKNGTSSIDIYNYKTGEKDIAFRMHADNRKADIAIELTHSDPEIRQIFFAICRLI